MDSSSRVRVQIQPQTVTAPCDPAPTAQIHGRSTGDDGAAWRPKRAAASSR